MRRGAARCAMAKKKQKILTPTEEVEKAYSLINEAIQPMLKSSSGGEEQVEGFRIAYGALQIMRQYAKVGALK